jgi:hypothetical protein
MRYNGGEFMKRNTEEENSSYVIFERKYSQGHGPNICKDSKP